MVLLDLLANEEKPDQVGHKGSLVLLDHKEHVENLALLVQMDSAEKLDSVERMDHLDQQDRGENVVRRDL